MGHFLFSFCSFSLLNCVTVNSAWHLLHDPALKVCSGYLLRDIHEWYLSSKMYFSSSQNCPLIISLCQWYSFSPRCYKRTLLYDTQCHLLVPLLDQILWPAGSFLHPHFYFCFIDIKQVSAVLFKLGSSLSFLHLNFFVLEIIYN